ncbi:MAG TPA: glycosyltransferase family 4 protein [Terrimicrobiaceae bacterium]
MPGRISAPLGFAYLFERFPSFSQTFCVREVEAMHGRGLEFPVFSIRKPAGEPVQDYFSDIGPIYFLPEKFDTILASDTNFRRSARRALDSLRALWGCEEQKRRIYEALWLGPMLREAGIRHIHVHFAGSAARTAFWLKRLFGVEYSVTAHANDIFRDEPPERLAQIFDAAAVVVTVSEFSLRYLRSRYPSQCDKFYRVFNGIEIDRFRTSSFPNGRPLILSVGRYIPKKGFCTLVEACSRLEGRDFECQIIGNGPLEESLKEQAALLGVDQRVSITGPKAEGEIKRLLQRSRMFVLACTRAEDGAMDNLPTVIMEAMAAGLPVVSTDVAAVSEMIADEETGFIVSERDSTALAQKIARLLDDPELARTTGTKGRERCLELFDLNRTSAALCEILTEYGAIPSRRADIHAFRRSAA